MLRTSVGLALSLGLLAAPALAEVHYVLLMGDGYFPEYVYPAIGDQVKFVNESDVAMAATATDGSWTPGAMAPGTAVLVSVTDGMTQTFVDSENTAGLAAGTIDYQNPPPLDLENNASSN